MRKVISMVSHIFIFCSLVFTLGFCAAWTSDLLTQISVLAADGVTLIYPDWQLYCPIIIIVLTSLSILFCLYIIFVDARDVIKSKNTGIKS